MEILLEIGYIFFLCFGMTPIVILSFPRKKKSDKINVMNRNMKKLLVIIRINISYLLLFYKKEIRFNTEEI